MNHVEISEARRHRPFRSFFLRAKDGRRFPVLEPEHVAITSWLLVVVDPVDCMPTHVSPNEIDAIEYGDDAARNAEIERQRAVQSRNDISVLPAKTKIGSRDHGRKMSLRAFEFAEVEEGCIAELARGYIVIGEVANYFHAMQIHVILQLLFHYFSSNPASIHAILSGSSSKLVVPAWESERHPDIAVYLSPPRGKKDQAMWRTWIPEFVIEVVSPNSADRDYTEKRDEYWTLGVKEYWIVDAKREQVLTLRRGRSQWIEKFFGPKDVCETKLLPGFQLACEPVFAAAGELNE